MSTFTVGQAYHGYPTVKTRYDSLPWVFRVMDKTLCAVLKALVSALRFVGKLFQWLFVAILVCGFIAFVWYGLTGIAALPVSVLLVILIFVVIVK